MIDLLYPPQCPCCGKTVSGRQTLCQDCECSLVRIPAPRCPFCGQAEEDCHCRKVPRPYDRVVAPFYYEAGAKELLHQVKFAGREDLVPYLADAMQRELEARCFGENLNRIMAVPATHARLRERGFDQARSLAEHLDREHELLCGAVPDWDRLKRRVSGGEQHLQRSRTSRKKNVRGDFFLRNPEGLQGETILLVDDIVTSGATASECAVQLKLAGAERVVVLAAAVTRFAPLHYSSKDLL